MSGMVENSGHVLDCSRIEEADEVNGEMQLCWAWCQSHDRLEWHSLPLASVEGQSGLVSVSTDPVRW